MATDRYSAKIRASPKFKAKVKAASSTPAGTGSGAGKYSAKVRASPKFQAKVQAARKPDSALTPTQRAARAWILKTQTPVTPGSSLSQAALASEAKAAATEKYAPAQQQATSNLKSAQQFASNTQDWYRQYQQAAAQNAQQVQAANAQANTAIQNLGGATAGLGGTDPQAGQANTVRQAMLGSIGALIAGQGANALRFADTQRNQIAPLQGQQASGAAEGIVRKALDDLKTLALQKGSFVGTYKGQRITDEQRNALAAATLTGTQRNQGAAITGIDPLTGKPTLAAKTDAQKRADAKAKAKQAAADKAASRKQSAHQWAASNHPGTNVTNGQWFEWGKQGAAGKQKRQDAIDAYNKANHPGKTKKTKAGDSAYGTNTQQIKIVTRINNAVAPIKAKIAVPGSTRDEIMSLAQQGLIPGVPKLGRDEFNAAFNIAKFGGITKDNVRALHGLGVQIKNRWKIVQSNAGGNNTTAPQNSPGAAGNLAT